MRASENTGYLVSSNSGGMVGSPPNRFADQAMGSKAQISGTMREAMQRLAERGVITPP